MNVELNLVQDEWFAFWPASNGGISDITIIVDHTLRERLYKAHQEMREIQREIRAAIDAQRG